jgi:mxaJ protein
MPILTRKLRALTAIALLAGCFPASADDTPAAATNQQNVEDAGKVLMVCADPSNLPYSNKAREGFENKIADVIASEMNVGVDYFWFAGHKTFMRRTLLEGMCDVVLATPQGLPGTVTTRPYFTSSFVAVTRANDERKFQSFDDPWLRDAKIGLQLVGNEGVTTPPVMSLAARGLNQHITGFPMWGDEGDPDPQGKIVDAVASGDIDVAFVWGPFAGHFAKKHGAALRVEPILSDPVKPEATFVFPMAVSVRKADTALRDRLQQALDRREADIAAILRDAGVPLVTPFSTTANVAVNDATRK